MIDNKPTELETLEIESLKTTAQLAQALFIGRGVTTPEAAFKMAEAFIKLVNQKWSGTRFSRRVQDEQEKNAASVDKSVAKDTLPLALAD